MALPRGVRVSRCGRWLFKDVWNVESGPTFTGRVAGTLIKCMPLYMYILCIYIPRIYNEKIHILISTYSSKLGVMINDDGCDLGRLIAVASNDFFLDFTLKMMLV